MLREAGYAPVAESADGAVLITRPDARRAAAAAGAAAGVGAAGGHRRAAQPSWCGRCGPATGRRSRSAGSAGGRDVPGVTTATTLGLLRDAARANQAVLLGYVNAQGTASQRIVEPVSVNGGYLHGYDHQRDEMRTFALHRITAVSVLPEDAGTSA